MNGDDVVLSLFDYSGNMVKPWAKNGYTCYCVDVKHDGRTVESYGDGEIIKVEADVMEYLPPRADYQIGFGFPPCTNLSVSGARWFKQKGLDGLSEAIELVERCSKILQWIDAPWMLENPVSTLSTYWRKPDFTFHPYQYARLVERDEAYSKKTCLWTGNGFEMPDEDPVEEYDDRIHKMAPSDDRSERRAETPKGFAKAVYQANSSDHDG